MVFLYLSFADEAVAIVVGAVGLAAGCSWKRRASSIAKRPMVVSELPGGGGSLQQSLLSDDGSIGGHIGVPSDNEGY